MIKATELRIGNLVLFGKSIMVVDTISSSDNAILIMRSGNHVTVNLKHCEPIKLTEDILLKCKMVKRQGWDSQVHWRVMQDENDHLRFELFETAQGYELPSGHIMDSLHVLQNAYCFHYAGKKELNVEL
jgi:hypothetical protein